MSSINAAVVARCVAALNAINAEFIIQADGVPLAQSPPRPLAETAGKRFTKPNLARNAKWGYHDAVRAMTIGVQTAFTLPEYEPDSMMEDYTYAVVSYAKQYHGARKNADWEVAVAHRTLYLTRLY